MFPIAVREMPAGVYSLANLTYRLHQQRERLAPGIEMRRQYVEHARRTQLRSEKEHIQSHIGRLAPGVRTLYLKKRLHQLRDVK